MVAPKVEEPLQRPKSPRGRPRLPDADRAVQVPMRIKAALVPKLRTLGREWLEQVIEQAPDI